MTRAKIFNNIPLSSPRPWGCFYNAATYYRYVSLDLGQLADTIGLEDVGTAVEAFTKALYIAVPSARQTTQTALCPWNYAHVYVRKGQGMQVCFDEPVKPRGGYLAPSIEALEQRLELQERLAGSLFGKKADFVFGKDETFTIDALAQALAEQVRP
ncbi:type I-E CRISPR-associated protein Cas7/Cse4/CasC [uncultured Mailhella sp.]|uniref:type I-E CRISPR-associated protein Cas7/Cse4/CasC n=1 Tax=uncultured Mailhella sp. TaxID=1981031 RepID=UPI002616BB19|nr:type I-E CRISPR-associated protein Cas7/Cse4/CasC [uncultured Mailhella sp.]